MDVLSFNARGLETALRDLARDKASGCLHVVSAPKGALVRLHFIEGFVAGIACDDPAYSLTGILIARQRIDSVAAANLDRMASRLGKPVAALVAESEFVSANQLDAARVELIHEAMHGLALFGVQSLEFRPGAHEGFESDLVVAVSEILSELELRRRATQALRRRFATSDPVVSSFDSAQDRPFDAAQGRPSAVAARELGPDEERVLALLHHSERFSRLLVSSGIGRWRTANAVDRLHQRGAVRLEEQPV